MRSFVLSQIFALTLCSCGANSPAADSGRSDASDVLGVEVAVDVPEPVDTTDVADVSPEAGPDVVDVTADDVQCEDASACGGQCTNLWRDPNNCGACGVVCPTGANAIAPFCITPGQCWLLCMTNFDDCNNDVSDGCESRLDTPLHCGSCGVYCHGTAPHCSGGRCVP